MYLNYVNCLIPFGQVPVGTTSTKLFPIRNPYHETVTYFVTRTHETNPIYHVFDVNKYEAKLEPGQEFNLKITYSPNVPGSKNYDYFKVVDTHQNCCRLCFEGECIGPLINCSVRYLNFYQMPENNHKKQIFQLSNNSRVSSIFQFDSNDEDQGVFRIGTLRGTIKPHKHVNITVNFEPQAPRLYSRQLTCLILYHEPIIINLFGICSTTKENVSEKVFRYFPAPYEETVGFRGYMSDSVTIKTVPPPVSLTVNHLDFGRIMPETSCQTLTTSFTNHQENEVEVEWEKVGHFRIYPQKLVVPAQKSALYECKFTPDDGSRLFSATIGGHITWTLPESEEYESLNVPIPINLRLIGHSFPKNESWIPSVSIIPSNVVLPLTIPNYFSWASFIIKSEGHLPVLFKLLPPGKTNFIMKPMVGLVRNYQIVMVQLEANVSEPTSFVEKWNIKLNGQVERLLPIYIKAQTEIPFIMVGCNNVIRFESMQPGTEGRLYLPIKNVSSCHLQYLSTYGNLNSDFFMENMHCRFKFELPEFLKIDPTKWELAPYEEIFAACYFFSDLSDEGEIDFAINCQLRCIVGGNVTGPPYEMTISVKGYCVYSELCAFPQTFDCGEVEYGTVIKTTFYLYNFGESAVNFKLCHDDDSQNVILHPEFGKCGPKEKIMISVTFTVKKIGRHCLMIGYSNRIHEHSREVAEGGAKMVFGIEYEGLHPVIQIVDLVDHNFGYLFDKTKLWEHFRIDEINSALTEVVQGEIKPVNCYIPDCAISPKLFYAVFVIKNISKIDTQIKLKRRQVCNCEPKECKESLSIRQKVYDCPHKDMLTLEISDPHLSANSSRLVTIYIKYLLEDCNLLSYFIELSNDRTVLVDFCINAVPPARLILSIFSPDYGLDLGYIYIGLREAPVQAFWLYNNTDEPIPYKLDELKITKLCNREGFPVLRCLNAVGFLKPRTRAPLLFRFWPIEAKTYSITVPLMLGTKMVDFLIEGRGTTEIDKPSFSDITSIITKPVKNNVISLSVDRIIVEPLLVRGYTERLFFIKNLSKTSVINYHWKPCVIDGLLKIEPLNSECSLQPKESHSVVIRIESLSEACSITVLLMCAFYDDTQFQYENAIIYNRDIKPQEAHQSGSEYGLADIALTEIVKLTRKPDLTYIAIPVTVNVVGVLDKDLCITVEDQMKQKPYQTVQIDVNNFVQDYYEKIKIKERPIHPDVTHEEKISQEEKHVINKDITQYVLECLVGDAVFSNYFEEYLKILKTEPSPLYSQIRFNQTKPEEARRDEIAKFLTQPEIPQVLNLCEDIVNESIHTTFQLGPILKDQ